LATDGSKDAAFAARVAVDLQSRSDAELHVVHAWTAVPAARLKRYIETQLEQEGRRVLGEEARRIEAAGGDLSGAHLREGRTEEIADLAEEIEAGLVVVGSWGLGTAKRLVAGSVSEGVVGLAPCPVLVVREGEEGGAWPPKRMVVGEDGSEEAGRAAELAAVLGRAYGARVMLLRARPPLVLIGAGAATDPGSAEEVLRQDEADLEHRAAELEDVLGERPRVKAVVGDPASALQQEAEEGEESTLVVVGRRGQGGVRRLLLGSVSTAVLRTTAGPILCV